jgi:hypothetical protein
MIEGIPQPALPAPDDMHEIPVHEIPADGCGS